MPEGIFKQRRTTFVFMVADELADHWKAGDYGMYLDLPVVIDPSHATGLRELVAPLSKAGVGVGGVGVLIGVPPHPPHGLGATTTGAGATAIRRPGTTTCGIGPHTATQPPSSEAAVTSPINHAIERFMSYLPHRRLLHRLLKE